MTTPSPTFSITATATSPVRTSSPCCGPAGGSLLFWSLAVGCVWIRPPPSLQTDPRLFAYASVVLSGVQIFFLLLLNFAAHPFAIVQGTIPADGNGLNPLLQYPEMVIHPPCFIGICRIHYSIAFALGASS